MQYRRGQCLFVFLLFFPAKVFFLENGLARTPPMGWMSWGYYMCGTQCDKSPERCLDEKLIMSVADTFFYEGYQEAGYEYIIIDDCWAERNRDRNGRLVPDKKRFPRGMKFLADYIHSRGLKFGMYTCIGHVTCMHYPGSKDHFKLDAQTFADWDVDYLKVDGCFVESSYLDTAYIDLGKQLNRTGRPMVYSCSWPYYLEFVHSKKPDYTPIMKQCSLWRNYHDVFIKWANVKDIIMHYAADFPLLEPYHGPGHWNDPDMLVLGNDILTENQSRVQLVVYAMLSAPLIISCDMGKITTYEKELLLNLDLIAIAQDPLGKMATPIWVTSNAILWVKKHIPVKGNLYHSYSFALLNLGQSRTKFTFTPSEYGLNSPDGYAVENVLTNSYFRNVTLNEVIDTNVPAEDIVLYTLFPL